MQARQAQKDTETCLMTLRLLTHAGVQVRQELSIAGGERALVLPGWYTEVVTVEDAIGASHLSSNSYRAQAPCEWKSCECQHLQNALQLHEQPQEDTALVVNRQHCTHVHHCES